MSCDKKGFDACGSIGLVVSIVFGALIGVLFNLGLIPFIVTTVWIVFGLAVLALILLVWGVYLASVSPPGVLRICVDRKGLCLLAGIIGTLIFSIVALSITLTTTILITIIIAILAFFFALMLLAIIALLRCIIVNLVPGN
jgi:hypothetical protein